jgi:dienelactone hydrolase
MKLILLFFKIIVILLTILAATQCQTSKPVEFTIDRHGIHLKGKFYISEGTGKFPTVILLQGFPGNEQDVLGIGKILSEVGINALTFNYSGTYQSEGEFNFENTQQDIQAALGYIRQSKNIRHLKIDTTRIYLGGYSYGGGMAFTYAANHPEIKSVFSIAGNDHGAFMREYNRNPEMKKAIDKMFDELKIKTETVRFGPGGTPKGIAELGIMESNSTFDLRNCAPLLAPKDILLIGGWDDRGVSIENNILPLYRALKNENARKVKITAVQDNHSFSSYREEITHTIIEWIKTAPEKNGDTNNQVATRSEITFGRNEVLLNGKIYLPEGKGPFPFVIFLKGFYEPEDDYLGMRKSLCEAGYAVLAFQYSGTDKSQGEFSFKNTQKDIHAAFEFIYQPDNINKYRIDTSRIHIGGLSYGGGMALSYAVNHPGIKSVFSIAGTDHGEFIREYVINTDMQQWFDTWIEDLAAPKGPVRIADGFSIKAIIDMGINNYMPILDLKESTPLLVNKHLLLIGGWDDTRCSLEDHLLPLYRALIKENAKKVRITAVQDNHSFQNSASELTQIIIDWLKSIDKEER